MTRTLFAVLAILFAFTRAATIVLPVTQDFAVVNQDRAQSVIARDDTISLFNNGAASSVSYFGVDTFPFIQEAALTTNSPIGGMVESATLIFNNVSIISEQVGAINIQISFLNPGQVWSENAVSLTTTPTINGVLGTVDFSKERPTLDVTDFMVQSLSGSFQGGLFGFHIGRPGGPIVIPSHRSDPDAVVVEIIYSPVVGPGVTAPPTPSTTTTTTTGAATTTSTAAPSSGTSTRFCWTCGAGWTHWYNVPGQTQPEDPCACVRIPSSTTTRAPGSPSTPTTSAPQAPSTPGSPQAPSTSNAPGTSSTGAIETTTGAPNAPERNSAMKMSASVALLGALLALWL